MTGRMKIPPKVVAVQGITSTTRIELEGCNCGSDSFQILTLPSNLAYKGFEVKERILNLTFEGIHPGRSKLKISLGTETFEIPTVVFRSQEFFMALVITSNCHEGFDPERYQFGYNCEGISGHGFQKAKRCLEPVFHKQGNPVTWLIDSRVAEVAHQDISNWHDQYGDDYGFMLSSFFNHNCRNYNLDRSTGDLLSLVSDNKEQVESFFPFWTDIMGVDQWVGSVGSRFVKACESLELNGVWGLGYDHFTCDTSMFHRGCPWDMYKPDKDNPRIPARYPSKLWAFQWTTRDIINTVHTPTGLSGSVIFSTDVDDIRETGILQNQPDYYTRLLLEHQKNAGHNEFLVFLVHQEDHDAHFEDDNRYLESFLDSTADLVTFATLHEIATWLNIKYDAGESGAQTLYLEDALTCQDHVVWGRGGVQMPEDWPLGSQYTPHGAFYDRDYQIILQRPLRKPFRVYDYAQNHPCGDTDVYPEECYPDVQVRNEEFVDQGTCVVYKAKVYADEACSKFPLVIWDPPSDLRISGVHTKSFAVVFLSLRSGDNDVELKCTRY